MVCHRLILFYDDLKLGSLLKRDAKIQYKINVSKFIFLFLFLSYRLH
ncbi:hypothetical protein HMPREF3218_0202288 [Prevotella bivia]|uniref:Uncharacterized protein n=1 Tax=Prevotella bivia TaxID=28125 RepID=A0A137T0R8_9BACT|nr:hypothetical protein HMPREF3202_00232 [Prevotella bivia]KXU55875.1 hypothetical protein HMPREF3218_0202288 [Prevotella bivia]